MCRGSCSGEIAYATPRALVAAVAHSAARGGSHTSGPKNLPLARLVRALANRYISLCETGIPERQKGEPNGGKGSENMVFELRVRLKTHARAHWGPKGPRVGKRREAWYNRQARRPRWSPAAERRFARSRCSTSSATPWETSAAAAPSSSARCTCPRSTSWCCRSTRCTWASCCSSPRSGTPSTTRWWAPSWTCTAPSRARPSSSPGSASSHSRWPSSACWASSTPATGTTPSALATASSPTCSTSSSTPA